MQPGDLVRVNAEWLAAVELGEWYSGFVGIILEDLGHEGFTVLINERRCHFHKYVLEPINATG